MCEQAHNYCLLGATNDELAGFFHVAPSTIDRWIAREVAPRRINAVAGADETAIAAAIDWLAQAPGVTGQLLHLDSQPPSEVIV